MTERQTSYYSQNFVHYNYFEVSEDYSFGYYSYFANNLEYSSHNFDYSCFHHNQNFDCFESSYRSFDCNFGY